jgi:hypothetical protein
MTGTSLVAVKTFTHNGGRLRKGLQIDVITVFRAWPEIIESTFERVKYRFTTERLYHMLWW